MMLKIEFERAVTWTLETFGGFDPRVQFMGVSWAKVGGPHTVYPSPYNRFRVGIQLPRSADEEWKVVKHLAHELVHCLTPNGLPGGRATVFEEGLCEHSAISLLTQDYKVLLADGSAWDWTGVLSGAYRRAFDQVEQLVAFEGLEPMRDSVRRLRRETGCAFADMSAETLLPYFSATPHALLESLSLRFHDA